MSATRKLSAAFGFYGQLPWPFEVPLISYPRPPELPAGFADWFAGSTMVGTDGKPRPFYHGTDGAFDTFTPYMPSKSGRGDCHQFEGFYFTADPIMASTHGRFVLVAYLHMRNPMRLVPPASVTSKTGDAAFDIDCITSARRAEIEALGYDGVIQGNVIKSEYVVFDPSQIMIVARHQTKIGRHA